jgi:membrane associated rhomboid family serine protease
VYLPLTSNAELRYWPFVTGAMILLNCLAFAIQLAIPSSLETILVDPVEFGIDAETDSDNELIPVRIEVPGFIDYVLSHGDGFHPIQWITSFFMHGSLMHLLGNMLFLWIFGHMVEGAVGPGKFLALYLGMGILQNIIEQGLFLGSPGPGSLGASSAIYAIMAIAGWLCPEDNIQGYFLIFYRAFFVEVPMFLFAVFYIGYDIFSSVLVGFEASTPVLHALGGLVGVVVGFVLLKFEFIENEGRDLLTFSQSSDKKPKLTKRQQADRATEMAEAKANLERQRAMYLQSLHMHLKAENAPGCVAQWINLQRHFPDFVLDENTILALINLTQKKQMWPELVKLGETYVQHYTTQETAIRLKVAIVLISKLTRPSAALRILQGLAGTKLAPTDKRQAQKLVAAAKKMLADGVLDFDETQ